MTIKYSGIIDNGTRCAIITYKDCKEDEKADKVMSALEREGYRCYLIGDGEITDIYIRVWDREEFNELKEIYLEAKRS